MEWFAGRENSFNDSLAGRVSGFMLSTSMADGLARMQDAQILQQILKMPNIDATQTIELLDAEKPLVYKANMPAAMLAELRPFLAERAELAMSMNVHAAAEEASQTAASGEASGSASIGFAFWKASMSMKASYSKNSQQKRSSDYSATTDMKLTMTRHSLAEGVSIIKNGMEELSRGATEYIVAKNKERLLEMSAAGEAELPEGAAKPEGPAAKGGGRRGNASAS